VGTGTCSCSEWRCTHGRPTSPEACTNGVDDDHDGLVDCLDPDCAQSLSCTPPPTEQNCSDGIDNDRDGLADCRDSDCASSPSCMCTTTNRDGGTSGGCCYPVCGPNETLQ